MLFLPGHACSLVAVILISAPAIAPFCHREKEQILAEASQTQSSLEQTQAELAAALKDKTELALECENLRTAVYRPLPNDD